MSRSQMRGYSGHHHQHNHHHHRHHHHHHHSQHADPRTPMAWRHRDMNFHPSGMSRPPSPSVASSSTDEQDDVPMVRHPPQRPRSRENLRSSADRGYTGHSQFTALPMDAYPLGPPISTGHYRNGGGTIRSTRSVPALALATWDGEPCPVHGHGLPVHTHPSGGNNGTLRRHGSMFDVRGSYFPPQMMMPPPPPSSLMDKKSFHGSMQLLSPGGPPPPFPMGPPSGMNSHIPPHLLPPMMRPRPMVIPAGAEPLPIRDPYKIRTPPPGYGSKEEDPYSVDQVCCKGHLIVLWIILAVVTVGVILGIILGVTIA